MMTRRLLWLVAIPLLLIAVPFVVLAVTLARLDPNDYAPRLISAVSGATGRTLGLGGPLRIRWSLHPTVSATDVTLANLPGGSRADIAHVERIDATLSLLPLLRHRIDIVSLTLTGPNILLEQVGTAPNWVFAPSAPTRGSITPPPYSLRFRHVRVVNGMVTFHFPARTKVIGLRTLDFRRPRTHGPFDLAAVLVYSDFKPATLHVHATPTGSDITPWTPWTTSLDASAFDATASAQGSMSLAGPFALRIEARAPALEALNALLPEMNLPALHRLTVSTHLSNGPVRGDLPVIGATNLHVGSADLGDRVPGLTLGGLDLSLPAAGGLARVAAAVRYQARPFAVSGTIGIPEHPDSAAAIPITLKAASPAATVSADGRIALRHLAFDGLAAAVALDAPALSALDPRLPALTAVSARTTLSIPAAGNALRLQKTSLRSAQIDATGDASIGPGEALVASLHADRLDLDALLPRPLPPGAAGHAPALPGPLFPTTPLPWRVLRGPAIDVTAAIDALTFAGRPWHDLALAAGLHDGRLRIDHLHTALRGGSPLDSTLTIDATNDAANVAFALKAPAIPLSLLAEAAGLPGTVDGNLAVDTSLDATGASPHDLAATLDGTLSMTAVGGSLSNTMLIGLASVPLDRLRIAVPSAGSTPIQCFGVIGTMKSGVGRFPVLALETGYLRMGGAGTIDLGQETLALELHPLAHVAGSSVQVPVVIDGPIRHPQVHTDISTLDKVGLAIDGLFGGDHPHTCAKAGLLPS